MTLRFKHLQVLDETLDLLLSLVVDADALGGVLPVSPQVGRLDGLAESKVLHDA